MSKRVRQGNIEPTKTERRELLRQTKQNALNGDMAAMVALSQFELASAIKQQLLTAQTA